MRELPTPTLPLLELTDIFRTAAAARRWWHWRGFWRPATQH